MDIRSFANVLSSWHGEISIKPGQARTKELTEEQVLKIFGVIPKRSIQCGYVITVSAMTNGNYKVVVRRER